MCQICAKNVPLLCQHCATKIVPKMCHSGAIPVPFQCQRCAKDVPKSLANSVSLSFSFESSLKLGHSRIQIMFNSGVPRSGLNIGTILILSGHAGSLGPRCCRTINTTGIYFQSIIVIFRCKRWLDLYETLKPIYSNVVFNNRCTIIDWLVEIVPLIQCGSQGPSNVRNGGCVRKGLKSPNFGKILIE